LLIKELKDEECDATEDEERNESWQHNPQLSIKKNTNKGRILDLPFL